MPDYFVKDAQAAQLAVNALEAHYGFMKTAGGAAESIRANVQANYATDGGSAGTFQANFATWQEGYQKAMTAVDTVWEQLNQQQNILDQGEEEALTHAKTGFDTAGVEAGIVNVLNGGGTGTGS
ncbi:hypothetical protein [Streptomyces sp. NPDC006012]|uniref:hypothetical protein n=1 Tax=Streptomyces sp. NPDC006012 TaxID=3364739 RepID=UPI0036A5436F